MIVRFELLIVRFEPIPVCPFSIFEVPSKKPNKDIKRKEFKSGGMAEKEYLRHP
ncbi:MAG: hypothetical protein UW76_C0031G0002 [Parcubacteria group bacterium GW2011_GWF2_44_8b]|nr:MAG: hypothetical protein UW76_C0031G0002 [Parcubacteria group bacterium GW2011_GWF2_44_8b]